MKKGQKHSKNSRKKMSLSKMGHKGYWLDKKFSIEHKRKISLNHANVSGENHPMYGVHRYGKDAPNYKGSAAKTPKSIIERNSSKNKQFIQNVLRRDNYTCLICDDNRGGNLEVDHIKPWSRYPELRYEPKNARTLCGPCHIKYGANPQWSKQAIWPSDKSL